MKRILIILLTLSFNLAALSVNASKQGDFSKPPEPNTSLFGGNTSGQVSINRQGSSTSISGQGSIRLNNNTSLFGGGWNAGRNRGVYGGINRRFKEEARHLVEYYLGLTDN